MKVENNKAFGCPSESMAISPSTSKYKLLYSVNGDKWDEFTDEIPAGDNAYVKIGISGLMFKLSGITGDVYIKY